MEKHSVPKYSSSILYNSLSQDIYAAHFLTLFDIYKYLRVKTMFIQQYEKIPCQDSSFETTPLHVVCLVLIYTAKK